MKLYGITRSWDSEKCADTFARSSMYAWIIADDVDLKVANLVADSYENGWYDSIDRLIQKF